MTSRHHSITTALTGGLLALALATPALATASLEDAITFTAQSGESVEAFQGHVDVPENRSDPDSRMIEIAYVRFPATTDNPGPPIIYLAGGPGGSGSGTARAQRFPLFMAMRQHGDVIAFDQRGTGNATFLPACTSSVFLPEDTPYSDAELADATRAAVENAVRSGRLKGSMCAAIPRAKASPTSRPCGRIWGPSK